ncbi:MAG: hypothetical protein ACRCWG_06360 [Sarcina sp.]
MREDSFKLKLEENDLLEILKIKTLKKIVWKNQFILASYCVFAYVATINMSFAIRIIFLFLPIGVIQSLVDFTYNQFLVESKYKYMFGEFEVFEENNILHFISRETKFNINLDTVRVKKVGGFIWINDNGFNMCIPLEIEKDKKGKELIECLNKKQEVGDAEFQSYVQKK